MSEESEHNQSLNSDNSDKFEDATDTLTKNNKEIIDEIIDKQSSLNLSSEDSAYNEEEHFVDCVETPLPDADEASQKDYENTLTEDELNANQLKANEFKKIGNDQYKNGEYLKSIESYSSGIGICPLRCLNDRAILYGNRAAAYVQLNNNTMAIQDCSKALDLDPKYIKVALRYVCITTTIFSVIAVESAQTCCL